MNALAELLIRIGCSLLGHPAITDISTEWEERQKEVLAAARDAAIRGYDLQVQCACGAKYVPISPEWHR